jgi:hypothetical protein
MTQITLRLEYMRLRKVKFNSIFLLLFSGILLQVSCSDKSELLESVFELNQETSTEDWKYYLASIGIPNSDLKQTVLLIVPSMNCMSCIQELEYWNRLVVENDENKISLIVIEKYEARFNNFINNNELLITAYRDSTSYLLKKNYLPTIPVKVYFGVEGDLKRVHPIGNDPGLNAFLADFKS